MKLETLHGGDDDIRNAVLQPGQRLVTTITKYDDGSSHMVVELKEPDRDAGMNSSGLKIIRKAVWGRAK